MRLRVIMEVLPFDPHQQHGDRHNKDRSSAFSRVSRRNHGWAAGDSVGDFSWRVWRVACDSNRVIQSSGQATEVSLTLGDIFSGLSMELLSNGYVSSSS